MADQPLRLKMAQQPYIIWSLGGKTLSWGRRAICIMQEPQDSRSIEARTPASKGQGNRGSSKLRAWKDLLQPNRTSFRRTMDDENYG